MTGRKKRVQAFIVWGARALYLGFALGMFCLLVYLGGGLL